MIRLRLGGIGRRLWGFIRGLGFRIWLRRLRGGLRDWSREFADGEPAASNIE